jgi:protein-S-isoprenylcysteine O-methyltransferase Ste14
MDSTRLTRIRALFVVLPIVALLLTALCVLGYLLCGALGIPLRFRLPGALRAVGLAILAFGLGVYIWLWRHRSPVDILVSTYVSWTKLLKGVPREDPAERSEPLVVTGPHRYVRHPLYAAAMVLVVGWWLLLDYTFLLLLAAFMFLWFDFVVAPFEERELAALFGPEYDAYAKRTPRFVPFLRRRAMADTASGRSA